MNGEHRPTLSIGDAHLDKNVTTTTNNNNNNNNNDNNTSMKEKNNNHNNSNHVLPNDTITKLKITLNENDLVKLDRFNYDLNKTIDGISFPLVFNDDNNSFKRHREISYAFKKLNKNIYNRQNTNSFEFEIVSSIQTKASLVQDQKQQQQQQQAPTPPITKWSQVAQQGALKNSKTNNVPTDATRRNASSHSQILQSTNIITSNALQPLGIVSLRLMYDKSFTDLSKLYTNVKIMPHGLINTGNICYMNSVLQMLLFCLPFHNVLNLVQAKTVANLTGSSRTPLLDATILFMNEFQRAGDSPLSPELFYQALSVHPKFSHLKWGQQEDLEEFLGYLLDGLHEEFVDSIKSLTKNECDLLVKSLNNPELKASINNAIEIVNNSNKGNDSSEIRERIAGDDGWHEVGSNKKIAAKRTVEIKPTPITLLFGGQFRSVLEVPKQKESRSITLDPFQHVQLDISDDHVETLEDLFKLLSEPEFIPYKSSNGNEVMARKQNFIDKLPNILIIHLKRFSFVKKEETTTYKIEKLRKKITYHHNLEIPIECISTESRKLVNNNTKLNNFKLIGVVYHHGMSPEGGHYTCDVMKQEDEWIRIDDGNISLLEKDEVLENNDEVRNAYILMFQRIL